MSGTDNMRLNNVLRSLCLAFIFCVVLAVAPAAASYSWENNITVGMEGMTWEYTEEYSGLQCILFRSAIDSELGNGDGFVAAWEILKMDTVSRKNLHGSVSRKMDVRINDSSSRILLSGVECVMSKELLGPVSKQEQVLNTYRVRYNFREPLPGQGDRIWFQGEPDTSVLITMPEGIDILEVEGIGNATIRKQGSVQKVKGDFDFTGEAVIVFRENRTAAQTERSVLVTELKPAQTHRYPSTLDGVFPGTTDRLLEILDRGSKL